MPGPHQHAPLTPHQRKHVARAHKIDGTAVVVGERAHGVGALLGRDAGGQTVTYIDRHGERGPERRIIERHHGVEMQALRRLSR